MSLVGRGFIPPRIGSFEHSNKKSKDKHWTSFPSLALGEPPTNLVKTALILEQGPAALS